MLSFIKRLCLFSIVTLFSLTAYAETVNALFHQAGNPVVGNPRGNVTVVEFFDYQCGHCISMVPVMDAIIRSNPNVRVVYKDFPIRGPASEFAARAALAANKQGKYYQFSHRLLTASEPLSANFILQTAKNLGLNVERLKKDMNSSSVTHELSSNFHLADQLNVTGTPAFFIGKTNATDIKEVNFVLGEMSQRELQDAINKASS